jgi:hypothetical protein
MNRSTWAGVVVLLATTCSSLMIAAPASAADGCGRGWRYSHFYDMCVPKRARHQRVFRVIWPGAVPYRPYRWRMRAPRFGGVIRIGF